MSPTCRYLRCWLGGLESGETTCFPCLARATLVWFDTNAQRAKATATRPQFETLIFTLLWREMCVVPHILTYWAGYLVLGSSRSRLAPIDPDGWTH